MSDAAKQHSSAVTSTGPRHDGSSAFWIFKPGQGQYVRWGTAIASGVIIIGFAAFLREQLTRFQNEWVEYLVPAAAVVVLAYLLFRLIGQNRTVVDFMIATEGEMKKVNWSSRREVFGATRVVIVTMLSLAVILFLVDILFMFFFESIDVLRVGMLSRLFGGGE